MIPAVFGLAGPAPTADEEALFARVRPAGYILFRRNIEDPAQLRALTDRLRALDGRDRLPILVDQEGGRVARMGPPHWPAFPAQRVFGEAWARSPITAMAAARANAQAIGLVLAAAGISVDCLPLVDVPAPEGHDIIGDRSFADDPLAVASLGRAVLDGLRLAGVAGVMKHVPGHGRATADSHVALPVVEADAAALERDLQPFRALAPLAPMAMTAHVVYPAWDATRAASLSPFVLGQVVRGAIGFAGILMSDDLNMEALAGQPGCATMAGRAVAVLEAGCDLALHCSGRLAEMAEIAAALGPMDADAQSRLARAMDDPGAGPGPGPGEHRHTELADALAERDRLLAAGAP